MRPRATAVCLAFCLVCAARAAAIGAPRWTDAELATFSDVILTGRVADVATGWDGPTIYTYATIDVDRVLKGWVPEHRIVIKQLGGRVDDLALIIDAQASFAAGERVLLFLEVRPRDRTLSTTALWQGKWTIQGDQDDRRRVVTRRPPESQTSTFGSPVDVSSIETVASLAAPVSTRAARDASRIDINVRPREASAALRVPTIDAASLFVPRWPANGAVTPLEDDRDCFMRYRNDGQLALVATTDSCGELSTSGSTTAISGAWVDTQVHSDAGKFMKVLRAGVVYGREHGAPTAVAAPSASSVLRRSGNDRTPSLGVSRTTAAFSGDAAVPPTARVSVSSSGAQANGPSTSPSISADGRYVAFLSSATNLVPGDTNGVDDIFVFDRVTGVVTRESVASDGTQANQLSTNPLLSSDGRWLVFNSSATNLTPEASPGTFLRDRLNARTTLVSLFPDGTPTRSFPSGPAAAAGTFQSVAFTSPASLGARRSIYVRDVQAGRTTLEVQPAQNVSDLGELSMGADGRYLAYVAFGGATNVDNIYVRDRVTGQTTLESVDTSGISFARSCRIPSLSADGRYIAFRCDANLSSGGPVDVYVRDRVAGISTKLATVDRTVSYFDGVALSGNGRFVTYNLRPYVYRVDVTTGQSVLISDGINAAVGNSQSGNLVVNGAAAESVANDGTVAFESAATNLVPGDTNNVADVFVGTGSPPGAPSNLTYLLAGSNASLTWTAPTTGGAVTGYVIEVGSSPGQSDIGSVTTGLATTFASPIGPGIYFVRVRAANSAGAGVASNEVVLAVAGGALPGAPTGLAYFVSGSTVTLFWSAPTSGGGATGYVIEAGSSSGGVDLARFGTGSTATSFTATGVPTGTYFVRVRAMNGAGQGPPSNEVVVIVFGSCATGPGAPSGLRSSVSGSIVTLNWNASAGGPTSYVVEAGSTPAASDLANFDTGSTSTALTAVGVGAGTYFVRVRGRNSCGVSAVSNEVIVVVP